MPLERGQKGLGKQVPNMGQTWVAGGWVFTHPIYKVEMMTSWEHDEIMYMMLPSMK
jgi:hypothetical protein